MSDACYVAPLKNHIQVKIFHKHQNLSVVLASLDKDQFLGFISKIKT